MLIPSFSLFDLVRSGLLQMPAVHFRTGGVDLTCADLTAVVVAFTIVAILLAATTLRRSP